ncbi:hypothetical protein [Arthrobacter sp. Bi83]|uniref:hypothetical protein n=1 Tax=Arthrobacter sp. Bi83 TaxID=2822353 RepID=UPI001E3B3F89|nr:hypothetical protein [Arthrobacter sp. Bi83]
MPIVAKSMTPSPIIPRVSSEAIGRLAVLGTAAGGSTSDGGTTVPVTGQVTLRRSAEPVSEAAA